MLLAFPLLVKPLGERAAMLAVLLLSILPAAVAYSRLGWDPSDTPAVALLVFRCHDRALHCRTDWPDAGRDRRRHHATGVCRAGGRGMEGLRGQRWQEPLVPCGNSREPLVAFHVVARGAPVLVIGIDNAFTVDADIAKMFIAPHPELDPSLPLRRIASLLEPEGIAFINAQPELAALSKTTGRLLYNGPRTRLAGHLEPEGDRLIGAIAARWLAATFGGR